MKGVSLSDTPFIVWSVTPQPVCWRATCANKPAVSARAQHGLKRGFKSAGGVAFEANICRDFIRNFSSFRQSPQKEIMKKREFTYIYVNIMYSIFKKIC
jgi:hypothetical protein